MFEGSFVALVTPFKNGALDKAKLKELIAFHIENGTDGIVPCGTTGESPTLSHEEHEHVIGITIETVAGRVPVLAGTGSNNTTEALRLTKYAKKAGADGVLLITPYYNRPTQKGLYEHYMMLADNVDIPMIVYNVPSRTGTDILPETLAKLAEHENIVGMKEATGQLKRSSEIMQSCGGDFILLSGDDVVTLPIMSVGGKGVISVVANIAPADIAAMCNAAKSGNWDEARKLHYKTLPLSIDLFIETNPIPVKTAMKLMGMLNGEMRLPLTSMTEENLAKLQATLKQCELIS